MLSHVRSSVTVGLPLFLLLSGKSGTLSEKAGWLLIDGILKSWVDFIAKS